MDNESQALPHEWPNGCVKYGCLGGKDERKYESVNCVYPKTDLSSPNPLMRSFYGENQQQQDEWRIQHPRR